MSKSLDDVILDSAAKLIQEKSFAAVTTREIAAAAGMHLGSLSYRYKNKEDILIALSIRGLTKLISDVKSAIDGASSPESAIRNAINAHIFNLLDGRAPLYVLLYEWRSVHGAQRRRIDLERAKYQAIWDGLLYRALGAGIIGSGVDLNMLRLALFGALNRCAQEVRESGAWSKDQIATQIFDLFFRRSAAPA